MEEILYIQEYYYYLITLIILIIIICFSNDLRDSFKGYSTNFIFVLFSTFTIFYLGNRNINIGFDTARYEYKFLSYKYDQSFTIRKDPLFDLLSFSFSRLYDFHALLLFCAFLYIFGAFYGLKKIFKKDFFLPFLIFLISPYFFNAGINVIRNGVAASIFIVGLGLVYNKEKIWKIILCFLISISFHISLFVPILFFLVTRYFKNTKILFLFWLSSIVLSILKINIVLSFIETINFFPARANFYLENNSEESSWINFLIFGFTPVVFAVYNVIFLKFQDKFYIWLVNAYMLTHIPYIILINNEFASRLGYLAEFMLPILLLFPLLKRSKFSIKRIRWKLCIIILVVFLFKAYKVLIV